MEAQLLRAIVAALVQLAKPKRGMERFSDVEIVKVFYWSVLHDRPVCWACQRRNWPLYWRRQTLPSSATLSRRLRTPRVLYLLQAVEVRFSRPTQKRLFWIIDGKPLVIGNCSKDRQAGYGRAAGGKGKGYKLHAVIDASGQVEQWRIAPMNTDERAMAARMLKTLDIEGYLVGDANYDSNPLHRWGQLRGIQLVTPRRYGPGKRVGHRSQSPSRLRSIAILENPTPLFGQQLLRDRVAIERFFGNNTNWGGGLNPLPSWVRTYRRVHRWVQAKLTLTCLRRQLAA
jgi:hypothetical protein